MGWRRLACTVVVCCALAVPAGASAAAPWTFTLLGLSQQPNTTSYLEVTNVSAGPVTVTAEVGSALKSNQTVQPADTLEVTNTCGGSLCVGSSRVQSTTPDLQVTLEMVLDGNTDNSVFTQNDFALVGPNGGDSLVLGNLASSDASAFATVQAADSTLASDLNPFAPELGSLNTTLTSDVSPLGPEVSTLNTTIAGLAQRQQKLQSQVAKLTTDVKALTKLLKRKAHAR